MTNTSTQGSAYTSAAEVQQNYPGVVDAIMPSGEVSFIRLSTVLTYTLNNGTPITEFIKKDGETALADTMTAIADIFEEVPEGDLSIHLQTIVTED